MAYRFPGTAIIEFAIAPISGATHGPSTYAAYFKRNATSGIHQFFVLTDSGLASKAYYGLSSSVPVVAGTLNSTGFTSTYTSTSVWYILAITKPAGTSTPRLHVWDGTSWTHSNDPSGAIGAFTSLFASSDKIRVGGRSSANLNADMVCVGIKDSDSTDGQIETLSPAYFQKWRDFTFDWLIGFDSSLVSGGNLQDQSAAGTGDQVATVGTTTLVSDPAGWAWTGSPVSTPNSGLLAFT